MDQVLMLIVAAVVLFAAGAGLGYWLAAMGRERSRADALQQELASYRERVNRHFATTAEHFQNIGREYRALYDHMATGANELCDTRDNGQRLSFAPAPAVSETGESPNGQAAGDTAAVGPAPPATPADGGEPGERRAAANAPPDMAADGSDDDSTPESRARSAGGESAPADDPGHDEDRAAAAETADEAPSDAEPAVVEDVPPAGEDNERIYH